MKIVNRLFRIVRRNVPLLLTAGSIVGVGLTSYYTGKAVLEADKFMNELPEGDLKKVRTKIHLMNIYSRPVACAVGTVACILGNHVVGKRATSGALAAYGVASSTLRAIRANMDRCQEKENMQAVHAERIQNKIPSQTPGEGYYLWFDDYRQNPYWARECDIREGVAFLNKLLIDPNFGGYGEANLDTFYKYVKGEMEDQDYMYGWCYDYMWENWDCGLIEVSWCDETYTNCNTGETIPGRYLQFFCPPMFKYMNYDTVGYNG